MERSRHHRPPWLRPPAALALGALAFILGVLLARASLPEWSPVSIPGSRLFITRFQAAARRAGISLGGGKYVVTLATSSKGLQPMQRQMHGSAPAARAAMGEGIRIEVAGTARFPGEDIGRLLAMQFTPAGKPLYVELPLAEWKSMMPHKTADPQVLAQITARLLLLPGEALGTVSSGGDFTYPVAGSRPPEHLGIVVTPGSGAIFGGRYLGREAAPDFLQPASIALKLFKALLYLGALALFLVFLVRRRIDLVNATFLALLCLALSAPPAITEQTPGWGQTIGLIFAGWVTLGVLTLWSTAESAFRSLEPGLVAGLDMLRRGRLGPRLGRALTLGCALGATLAGLLLALHSLATVLPGSWPRDQSPSLPILGEGASPLLSAVLDSAWITLLLSIARRWLHGRWALLAATLAVALFRAPAALHPLGFEVAANILLMAPFVYALHRGGLVTLLAAALAFRFLPAAALSGLHLSSLPVTFALTASASATLILLGWAGLRRPPGSESEPAKPPAFLRRLEDERRVKYEMDLLVRMQLGLLPQQLPELPGWQIAARSLLATEASGDLYDFLEDEEGQLWVAAGDVAGHGYSCSIIQAMTSAALGSLIGPGKLPSEVLLRVDQVLRRRSSRRVFTSLALLRLDPLSGSALLANAGHPFPFFLRTPDSIIAEVALPGLPLGQGPARAYVDEPLHLPPGSLLVFCSDGLFEATDTRSDPYGYDRPRDVLQQVSDRSASEVLETLLADWRVHLGGAPPPDDTTIVVIKRLGHRSLPS